MGQYRHIVSMALICGIPFLAGRDGGRQPPPSTVLPPVETFVLKPIVLEHLRIWVPASMSGPNVNRSCGIQRNCLHACLLPAGVDHVKSDACLDAVARVLAEHAAPCHERSLPLTIFNGWQWEYAYSLSQYTSTSYDLPGRGGSWQCALEAILTVTAGTARGQWLSAATDQDRFPNPDDASQSSRIVVETFDSIRVRDGYPKIRQF